MALGRAVRHRRRIDFRGRSVLVTGGSRGLGLVMARELAAEGARLTLLARDPDELAAAVVELEAAGAEVLAAPCDVGDRVQAEEAVRRAVERFGGLDVLVNNAGVVQVGPLAHMRLEDFEEAMRVHFWGPLYLTLAALPHLPHDGSGRIVNVASIGGLVAIPHLVPYGASKFALVGLSDGLRAELASSGVRVTTVAPGLLRTGSHLRAEFKGHHAAEFTWFSVAGTSPLASISATRAAHQILDACRHGDPYLILTPQARLLARLAHLAPNWTARAMAAAARLLPTPTEEPGAAGDAGVPGADSPSRWAPSLLTRLGDNAAAENNELRAFPRPV